MKRMWILLSIIIFLPGCLSQEIKIGPKETTTPVSQTENPIVIPTTSPISISQTTLPPSTQQPSSCIIGHQDGLPVISWKCADQYYGQEVIVEGVIIFTWNTGTLVYLNFYYDIIDEANKKASLAYQKYLKERTPSSQEEAQKTLEELEKLMKEKIEEYKKKKKFSAIIYVEDSSEFPSNPEIHYLKKRVRVRGTVEEDKSWGGKPMIILKNSSQIWIVG